MKKMKWIALVALTLAAVMALSSCAMFGGKKGDIAKLLDEEATYTDKTVTYANASKVDALTGKTKSRSAAHLVYFTDSVEKNGINYTQHTIYNAKTNSVVYTVDNTATSRAHVTMRDVHMGNETYAYFLITTASWNVDADSNMVGRYTVRTELYDDTGTRVAGVADTQAFDGSFGGDYITVPEIAGDLLYFAGNCYRFGEDGKLNKAFEYGELSRLPNIVDYNDEYYVAFESVDLVVFYDRELSEVSSYRLPEFEVENMNGAMLRNGKLFVQYYYELPADAKKYDFVDTAKYSDNIDLEMLAKYDLVTLLVDPKNGKAKEIKCDYLVNTWNGTQYIDTEENNAISFEKIEAMGLAAEIVDGRLSEHTVLVIIDKKGNVTELTFNGENVRKFVLLSDNRVVVDTEAHVYLVDLEGNVIGKIDNAQHFGSYLLCGDKVYDYDLTVKLDLFERNYVLYACMDEYLLLENADGDLLLYTGDKDPYVIVEDDGDYYLADAAGNFYVLVKENDEGNNEYEIYNAKGEKITAIEKLPFDSGLEFVVETEDSLLLKTTQRVDAITENVYYRLTK